MIEETEALERILAEVPDTMGEPCPLLQAQGRFAAEEVRATVPMPRFDNSAMDGYAVRAADAKSRGAELGVVGEQPAGRDLGLQVGHGEAIRIFTGAPMPRGADAVVMQEDVARKGENIRIDVPVEEGEFVRRRGSDLCQGQVVLHAGERICPKNIALLASQGLTEIRTGGCPRIALVSTGDELAPPGGTLESGQIFNSNGPMLVALARQWTHPCSDIVPSHYHAPDDEEKLRETLGLAMSAHDMVVISGGVSVGERDLVKEILAEEGVETRFWRVRLKPGKPFLFGRASGGPAARRGALVFGLPGNPVSAFVTFFAFVRPALLKRMGASPEEIAPQRVRCRLSVAVANEEDRPHYVRGRVSRDGAVFDPSGLQQSHALFGLSHANALLRMDPGERISSGDEATVTLV